VTPRTALKAPPIKKNDGEKRMDLVHAAALLRSLGRTTSRRSVLAVLISGLIAAGLYAPEADETEAKKHGKRQKKRKRKKKDKPSPTSLPPPGAVTRADATCPDPTGAFLITDGDERIAQTFTAIGNGALVRAELVIFKVQGTFGDYILHLGAVDAFGVPSNEVLAESVVANARVPANESTLTFSFANPATVATGTQYALVLTRPGSSQLEWLGSFGDPCFGRAFISPNQTTAFEADNTGLDLGFTTFVSS
jgi:hypothetical protein